MRKQRYSVLMLLIFLFISSYFLLNKDTRKRKKVERFERNPKYPKLEKSNYMVSS